MCEQNALTLCEQRENALAASTPHVTGRHVQTERYLEAVRRVILLWAVTRGSVSPHEAEQISSVKLVYGTSPRGQLGAVYVSKWHYPGEASPGPLLSISATGQRSPLELCCTLIHEMGHLLNMLRSLPSACDGHGPRWKLACRDLGHARPFQTWIKEDWALDFDLELTKLIQLVPTPTDGESRPDRESGFGGLGTGPRGGRGGCSHGSGVRGGKSRLPGANRNVAWICGCPKPAIIRGARSCGLDATCNACGQRLRPLGSNVPAKTPA